MCGFVVAAISPAVVVPALMDLMDGNPPRGRKSGIANMVIAAAPLDDVIAISGFSIMSSFALPNANAPAWLNYVRPPLELSMGPAIGIGCAYLLTWVVPSSLDPKDLMPTFVGRHQDYRRWRSALLLGASIAMIFGLNQAGF